MIPPKHDAEMPLGDSVYAEQGHLIAKVAPEVIEITNLKGSPHKPLTEWERGKHLIKSQVRAKVEHAFLVIKRFFGFAKVSAFCKSLRVMSSPLFKRTNNSLSRFKRRFFSVGSSLATASDWFACCACCSFLRISSNVDAICALSVKVRTAIMLEL